MIARRYDPEHDRKPEDPTRAEIAKACREIRRSWDRDTWMLRFACNPPRWLPPEARVYRCDQVILNEAEAVNEAYLRR